MNAFNRAPAKRPLHFARDSDSGITASLPGTVLQNLYVEALPLDAISPVALVSAPGVAEALELQNGDEVLAMEIVPNWDNALGDEDQPDDRDFKTRIPEDAEQIDAGYFPYRLIAVTKNGNLYSHEIWKAGLEASINPDNPLIRISPAEYPVLAGSFDLDGDNSEPQGITEILDFFWIPDNSGEHQSNIYAYSGRSGSYWPTKTIEAGFDPEGNRINFEEITSRYEDEFGERVTDEDKIPEAFPVLYAKCEDTELRNITIRKDGVGAGNPVNICVS